MIENNNPNLKSWITVPNNSDFPIQNIPFGIAKFQNDVFPATRIGNTVINLHNLFKNGFFNDLNFIENDFSCDTLNAIFSYGKDATQSLRNNISLLFRINSPLRASRKKLQESLHPVSEVEMMLPVTVGDYTDFYSSEYHATNVGTMFRDPKNALLPNWKHIPVAYHGRASSIIPSGIPVHRPCGQTRPDDNQPPIFGPCKLLDFELEMAFLTYQGKQFGHSISTDEADDYIIGMVLFNDWSARDIQKWEYIPLGPFLSKNFASSISSWIVTLDALEPFRIQGPVQTPTVLPYLNYSGKKHIDINLEVSIQPENSQPAIVSNTNYRHLYWNIEQQLAHHSINGCNIRNCDMMASGTISGPDSSSYGSMLEITWRGSKKISMPNGTFRKFINDNDTVIFKGWCKNGKLRIGFGDVTTKILPTLL